MVLTRRLAGFLLVAGAFQWLVWPNFMRVVWIDKRAFGPGGGPTAFLLVHVAIVVPALILGTALLWLGARAWRAAPRPGAVVPVGLSPRQDSADAGRR